MDALPDARSIERMGGEVGVESAAGQGSRFWLELPTAGPALDAPPESAREPA